VGLQSGAQHGRNTRLDERARIVEVAAQEDAHWSRLSTHIEERPNERGELELPLFLLDLARDLARVLLIFLESGPNLVGRHLHIFSVLPNKLLLSRVAIGFRDRKSFRKRGPDLHRRLP